MFPAGVRVGGVPPTASSASRSASIRPYAPFFVAEKGGPVRGRGRKRADHPDRGRRRERPECRGRHFRDVRQRRLDRVDGDGRPTRPCAHSVSTRNPTATSRWCSAPASRRSRSRPWACSPVSASTSDAYLRSVGLDPAAVKLVSTSPPEQPALLARGDIDGFISFDPWVAQAVATGGRVVGTSGDFGAGTRSGCSPRSRGWPRTRSWQPGLRGGRRAAAIVNSDRPRGRGDLVGDPDGSRGGEAHGDPDRLRRTRLHPRRHGPRRRPGHLLPRPGKITGSVDTDTVMLHGWVSEHTTPNDRSVLPTGSRPVRSAERNRFPGPASP